MTPQSTKIPIPQKVKWETSEMAGGRTGMVVESEEGVGFVPWTELKSELERMLLIQVGRVLGDRRCTINTADFHGRKDWTICIMDEDEKPVGYVWLGGDPYAGWKWDGLVRVGNAPQDHTAKVWQIFERYSDGSYRRVAALDGPEDRLPSR